MPYKDAERKRQWEQEHRAERNARRRKQPALRVVVQNVPISSHDPMSNQELQVWQLVVGLALGIGVVVGIFLITRWTLQWRRREPPKKVD